VPGDVDVVVDASIVVKWVLTESDFAEARALAEQWRAFGMRMVMPVHGPVEVAGAIRRHQRLGAFDLEGAKRAFRDVLAVGLQIVDDPGLYVRALELADQYGRSVPDAMYLALAESLGCELWTADGVLRNAVSPSLARVRLLGQPTR